MLKAPWCTRNLKVLSGQLSSLPTHQFRSCTISHVPSKNIIIIITNIYVGHHAKPYLTNVIKLSVTNVSTPVTLTPTSPRLLQA